MTGKTFSVIKVIGSGWRLYKSHWRLSLIIAGAVVLIQMMESFFMTEGMEDMITAYSQRILDNPLVIFDVITVNRINAYIGIISALLIRFFIYAGIYCMMLLIMNGHKTGLSFEGFAMGRRPFWMFVAVSVVVALISLLGALLLIIPGIVLGLRLQYATYIVLEDDDTGIIESIKKSWRITRGNTTRLLVFSLLALLIYALSIACCFIGLFVAIPWMVLADMIIYKTLTREGWDVSMIGSDKSAAQDPK